MRHFLLFVFAVLSASAQASLDAPANRLAAMWNFNRGKGQNAPKQ